ALVGPRRILRRQARLPLWNRGGGEILRRNRDPRVPADERGGAAHRSAPGQGQPERVRRRRLDQQDADDLRPAGPVQVLEKNQHEANRAARAARFHFGGCFDASRASASRRSISFTMARKRRSISRLTSGIPMSGGMAKSGSKRPA